MDLREYIKENKININKFSRSIGVTPCTIHNLLNGRDVKMSIAVKIERYTAGNVSCDNLYEMIREIEFEKKQMKKFESLRKQEES